MTVDHVPTNLESPPLRRALHVTRRTACGVSGPGPSAESRVRPPVAAVPLVERPRLLNRLSSALEGAPLALVSGPAGYGKTVLASAWARQPGHPGPVAWLSLTERDAQPSVFWSHVVFALAFVGALGADIPYSIVAENSDIDGLGDVLLVGGPIVLVLDAAERVRNRPVFSQLARLVESAEGRLRILMTTRVDPPLPLHRYRLENTVAEVRFDELAFTDSEATAALRASGARGRDEASVRVLSSLEGWPAGVRMAGLSLQRGQPDVRLEESVADYLEAEIFDGLTVDDREFLLRLSVVNELPPGLSAALSGRPEAEESLKRMSVGNTFVQPVPGRPGYRIHPVFRQWLATRLAQRPAQATEQHRRAADWYAVHGDRLGAVDHAATSGDWQRAADFGDAHQGIADSAATIGLAGTQLLRALVLSPDRVARLRDGDPDGASAVLRDASRSADISVDNSDDVGRRALATLAVTQAYRGQLSAALDLADAAACGVGVPVAVHLARAWVAMERQDLVRARDELGSTTRRDAIGCGEIVEDAWLGSVSGLLRARLIRDRGDVAGARRLLAELEVPLDWLASLVRAEASAVGLAVDEIASGAVGNPEAHRVIELLADTQTLLAAGDRIAARAALAEALSLSKPELVRRPFVHLPAEIRAMLRDDQELRSAAGWLRPKPTKGVPEPDRRSRRGTSAVRRASHDRGPIRPELSSRELEVLRQLSALLTTEEIAAQLFISVNTVRTHVRRILEKLGVSRRYEAVRRGRELGLL